jgi:hypothetical protein
MSNIPYTLGADFSFNLPETLTPGEAFEVMLSVSDRSDFSSLTPENNKKDVVGYVEPVPYNSMEIRSGWLDQDGLDIGFWVYPDGSVVQGIKEYLLPESGSGSKSVTIIAPIPDPDIQSFRVYIDVVASIPREAIRYYYYYVD